MDNNKYICKKQIFEEFGISKATFYRFVKRHGIPVSRRLLSPTEATQLRKVLHHQMQQEMLSNEGRLSSETR